MKAVTRRKAFSIPLLVIVVLAMAAGWLRAWVSDRLQAVSPGNAASVTVQIPTGLSTRDVAELLHQRGLVRDAMIFSYYARYQRLDSKLQGGEYQLSAAMTPAEILTKLTRGEVLVRRYTVPEGMTLAETADLVAARVGVDKRRFLQAAAQSHLADQYLPKEPGVHLANPLEGYLFPSTYDYRAGVTEADLISMMFARVEQVWTPELRRRADELKLTAHQVMVLASIIEEEAQAAKERPVISGVYHNRLQIGMKLDADPTVRYALNKPPTEPLLYKDLDVESPYNTYRVAGLPPGPIAAPGEASIRAALYPAAHDFLYFVAKDDGSGEHYFARSLDEHDQNTARAAANQGR